MWHEHYRVERKPFFRRAWFLTLLGVIVVAALGALFFGLKKKSEYEARAAKFDFAKLREMESASIIYDRNNKVLGRIYLENRDTISLGNLPYEMIQAVIAAED